MLKKLKRTMRYLAILCMFACCKSNGVDENFQGYQREDFLQRNLFLEQVPRNEREGEHHEDVNVVLNHAPNPILNWRNLGMALVGAGVGGATMLGMVVCLPTLPQAPILLAGASAIEIGVGIGIGYASFITARAFWSQIR
jgi:hypothetical protein